MSCQTGQPLGMFMTCYYSGNFTGDQSPLSPDLTSAGAFFVTTSSIVSRKSQATQPLSLCSDATSESEVLMLRVCVNTLSTSPHCGHVAPAMNLLRLALVDIFVTCQRLRQRCHLVLTKPQPGFATHKRNKHVHRIN